MPRYSCVKQTRHQHKPGKTTQRQNKRKGIMQEFKQEEENNNLIRLRSFHAFRREAQLCMFSSATQAQHPGSHSSGGRAINAANGK